MDLDRLPSEALPPLLWSSQWSMYGYSASPWRWCFSTRISCLGAGKRIETFKNIEVIGKLTEFCLRKEEGGWYGPPLAWGTHLELTPGWLLPPLQNLPPCCPLVLPPRFVQKLGGAATENDHLSPMRQVQCVNIMDCGKELGNTAIIFDTFCEISHISLRSIIFSTTGSLIVMTVYWGMTISLPIPSHPWCSQSPFCAIVLKRSNHIAIYVGTFAAV